MNQCAHCGRLNKDDARFCIECGTKELKPYTEDERRADEQWRHEAERSKLRQTGPPQPLTEAQIEKRRSRVIIGAVLVVIGTALGMQWRSWMDEELLLVFDMRDRSEISIRAPRRLMQNDFSLAYGDKGLSDEAEKLTGPAIYSDKTPDRPWRWHGVLSLDIPDAAKRRQCARIEDYVKTRRWMYGGAAITALIFGVFILIAQAARRRM